MAASETLPIEFGRKTLATLARAAQAGGRVAEMYAFATRLVTGAHGHLTVDERDLLVSAQRATVDSAHAAWRALRTDGPSQEHEVVAYRLALRAELEAHAETWDGQVGFLLASAPPPDAVLYRAMTGDQYAVLAELAPDRRDAFAAKAAASYAQGAVAAEKLAPTHPIRLGLLLNYATCKYEILKDHKLGIALAKQAFDDAISKLDQLDEASYKLTTPVMQALRDRLTAWTAGDVPASD